MIKSFKDKRTETLFNGYRVPAFSPDLARQAYRKLKLLNAATCLQDLLIPPANRLEALKGDPQGAIQHSDKQPMAHLFRLA